MLAGCIRGESLTRPAWLGALLAVCVAPLGAQPLLIPRAYVVSHLAAGEVLNVRASPSSASEDIGDLPVGTAPVEVIETDAQGRWGRIAWRGTDGWVSMRYLAPAQGLAFIADSEVPSGLRCTGTEPFWSLEFAPGARVRLAFAGAEAPLDATLSSATTAANQRFPVVLSARAEATELTAIVRPANCSDGMSDARYGWSVDVLRRDEQTLTVLTGCCQLPLPLD